MEICRRFTKSTMTIGINIQDCIDSLFFFESRPRELKQLWRKLDGCRHSQKCLIIGIAMEFIICSIRYLVLMTEIIFIVNYQILFISFCVLMSDFIENDRVRLVHLLVIIQLSSTTLYV